MKLPVEVSEGDRIALPADFCQTNAIGRLQVNLRGKLGSLLRLERPVDRAQVRLQPCRAIRCFIRWPSLAKGQNRVRFAADAGGLRDEFVREIAVAPRGFPPEYLEVGPAPRQRRCTKSSWRDLWTGPATRT